MYELQASSCSGSAGFWKKHSAVWQTASPIRQTHSWLSDSSAFQHKSENPVVLALLTFKLLKTVIYRSHGNGTYLESTPYNRVA